MFFLNVINSIISKPGNIGFRFSHIQEYQSDHNLDFLTIARGNDSSIKKGVFSLGFFSIIPRGLHYLRRNYFKGLNTRKPDLILFEMFFFLLLPYILFKSRKHTFKTAYIVESSPVIIKTLKKFGFKIVLDVPIVPNNYVKTVTCLHKTSELVYHKYLDDRERLCFELSDVILAPSVFVCNEISLLIEDYKKIQIIPFGSIQKKSREVFQYVDKKGIDFVFAGNVSSRKGINFLIDAWEKLNFENDRLHLCGKVTKEIKDKISLLKSNSIILSGFVDVAEYFDNCDVYVFPSLMEGSSKSVYEAMASSLPCIVTYQSGSVIEHGVDGLLIDAFSSEEIQEALLKIKTMDLLSLSKNAHKKSQNYTWDLYSKKVMRVLSDEK